MGGQKGIALFYKYLSQYVDLACLTIKKNESDEPFTILNQLSNARSRYINPLLFFKIKKLLQQNDCTHLLLEHPYYAWLLLLCKLFTTQKIIVHSHNIESERFKSFGKWWWKLLWYYEGFAYRKADIVWFKTDEDKNYAQLYFKVKSEKCHTMYYGIEQATLPLNDERYNAKKQIAELHHLATDETFILFNGTLNYKPNIEALQNILENINPLLLKTNMRYKILICGKGLAKEMNALSNYVNQHIVYCGFVDDIDLYFKGCDIFLNPMQDGGGVKTKLVEALGFGMKAVSSVNGAYGVDIESTGGRLKIVADKDWNAYQNAVVAMNEIVIDNNHSAFYAQYHWGNIAKKAATSL